jgi:magnesium transporter
MEEMSKRELIGNEGLVILDMVQRLNRRKATGNLVKLITKTHPADMAWVFRHLSKEERNDVFQVIAQTSLVGEFLSELDKSIMLALVEDLSSEFMAKVISKMPSDDAVDLIAALPEDVADNIRKHMNKEDREEVDELLQHDPQTAGGLM